MSFLEIVKTFELLYLKCGYFLVFISSLIETSPLGFAIPGGAIVALGGFYSYGTGVSLIGVVLFGSLGMLITFYIAYFLGKHTGLSLAKKLNQEKSVDMAKHLLQDHGPVILTTSLLANLTRFWMAYVAGVQEYNLFKFTFYAVIASLTWTSFLATIGYIAGSERNNLESKIVQISLFSWILLIFAASILFIKIKKELSKVKK